MNLWARNALKNSSHRDGPRQGMQAELRCNQGQNERVTLKKKTGVMALQKFQATRKYFCGHRLQSMPLFLNTDGGLLG